MKFKMNFNSFIYLTYSLIIFFIYYSDIIKKLIHPRMHFVVLLSGFIFLLFFIVESISKNYSRQSHDRDCYERRKKTGVFKTLLYMLPILLVIFMNSADLSNSAIKNKGINVGKNVESKKISEEKKNDLSNVEIDKEHAIVMNDKNYIDTIDELGLYLDVYSGKTIIIRGMIYRDETMKSDQFVIGRLAMTCCSADASLVGLLSTYESYNEIKDNEWYEAVAIIDQVEYDGFDIAYLNIKEIKKIDKPNDEYVY